MTKKLSVPAALIHSLQSAPGFQQAAFEAVHESGDQVVSIRLNPQKQFDTHHLPIGETVKWCMHGRYLASRPFFTFDPYLHAGAYYVQEASSMFLWQAITQSIPETSGKKVLDLCAAPGGKSTLLASYFQDGLVVANEVIKPRVNILIENAVKWGSGNLWVTNNDPMHFQSVPDFFDVMVVDAPCSGSGLFRKDPEAMNEWSEANVDLCSQRQQRILADAMPCLKEDGILIYSTCSYSQEEDEAICDWLVANMGMESLPVPFDADWGIIESRSSLHQAFGYRFYPDKIQGEGFFLACFRKKEVHHSGRIKTKKIPQTSKDKIQQLRNQFMLPEQLAFFDHQEAVRAIELQWMESLTVLASNLYIKKAGVGIAEFKGKDIIPMHELALSNWYQAGYPEMELDLDDALNFLRRKELKLDGQKGWNRISYGGYGIGWAKVLPNRMNNYYPAEWRILKE